MFVNAITVLCENEIVIYQMNIAKKFQMTWRTGQDRLPNTCKTLKHLIALIVGADGWAFRVIIRNTGLTITQINLNRNQISVVLQSTFGRERIHNLSHI